MTKPTIYGLPDSGQATAPAGIEGIIEDAFWRFDAERKATGAERDAFKRQLRGVMVACMSGASLAIENFFQDQAAGLVGIQSQSDAPEVTT